MGPCGPIPQPHALRGAAIRRSRVPGLSFNKTKRGSSGQHQPKATMKRTLNRYRVSLVDHDGRGEPPTYEVRKNAGGPADDYDQGECIAVFNTRQEAEDLARKLTDDQDDNDWLGAAWAHACAAAKARTGHAWIYLPRGEQCDQCGRYQEDTQ